MLYDLFYGSAILLGLILSVIIERLTLLLLQKKHHEVYAENTILDKHIKDCICFKSDTNRSIDDVVSNLKTKNIDADFRFDINN